MHVLFCLLVSSVVLSGCGLDPEYRARREAMIAKEDDAYCKGIGATPGTDTYVQCRMFKSGQNQQMAIANAQRSRQVQADIQRAFNPPRVNCTSNTLGSTVNTTCY